MLCEQELNEFFTHIDEISQTSQDSVAVNHFQIPNKLEEENAKLKAKLKKVFGSTREVLDLVKNEISLKETALRELETTKSQLHEIKCEYDVLQKENININFKWKQKFDELEYIHNKLNESHAELSTDYLDVLSETTMSFYFEINRARSKIVNKTEAFLQRKFGSKFHKPKIISRKQPLKKESNVKKNKKQQPPPIKEKPSRKRKKIENFDMQSISQVSSPASYFEEVGEVGREDEEIASDYSFTTFSIGNETSYSVIANNRKRQRLSPIPCKCSILEEEGERLVSIGVNTEEIIDVPLPSVMLLNPTDDGEEETIKSIGTNTEDFSVEKCHKSTSTVHSSITRGTSTPQITTKNFGLQYPEINFDKIFAETIFTLPDCLSPISELECLIDECEKEVMTRSSTQETQTNLLNVCREIDYVTNVSSSEEQSFNQLGKTVFNLFLERIKKVNKSIDDDASTREKLWAYMQQQFFDRFNEFTFDDYFNVTIFSEKIQNKENIEDNDMNIKEIEKIEKEESKQLNTFEMRESKNDLELEEIFNSIPSPPPLVEKINDEPPILFGVTNTDLFVDMSDCESKGSSRTSSASPASICESLDVSSDSEEEMEKEEELIYDSPMSPPMEDRGEIYIESPASPPPSFCQNDDHYEPIDIPWDVSSLNLTAVEDENNPLEYNSNIRSALVRWQHQKVISNIKKDKIFCKIRKFIKNYLDSEWNDENLELCLKQLENKSEILLVEAIFETVEDHEDEKEISTEFTPPAPPLPCYQQKLILLIKKLSEKNVNLPQMLMMDLEVKLFKCEMTNAEVSYLRNITYYYTSLVDLFFEGNTTMVYYFIIKCIYFFNCKSIPMVFVLIKAFPDVLPMKKSLLKNNCPNHDWENMTGFEVSKVRLDVEWVDSLDLTVFYLLTCIQMYRKKDLAISQYHELFNYLPKFYGFGLNFIAAPKLLDTLVKRFEDGQLNNLSLSFILLAKRMNLEFTMKILLKGKLVPLLNKLMNEISEEMSEIKRNQLCCLLEVISSILKAFSDEKDKSFKEIFPLIVNILGRAENCQKIQEYCIQAILRLHRFIDNHKEIYDILQHHYEKRNSFSESLRYSIATFIHRKNEIFFQ